MEHLSLLCGHHIPLTIIGYAIVMRHACKTVIKNVMLQYC